MFKQRDLGSSLAYAVAPVSAMLLLLLLLLLLFSSPVGAFLLYNNCFCTHSKPQQVKGSKGILKRKKFIKIQNRSFLLCVDFWDFGVLLCYDYERFTKSIASSICLFSKLRFLLFWRIRICVINTEELCLQSDKLVVFKNVKRTDTIFISCVALWKICHLISAQDLIPFHEKGELYKLVFSSGWFWSHWNILE